MSPTNRILLVQGRRTGKWSFPKGHRNAGESHIECAVRETKEETGLDLSLLVPMAYHKLSAGEYYFFEMCGEAAPVIHDTSEVMNAGWWTVEEMRRIPCNVDVNYFLNRIQVAV